jgi:hypothetical protein
VTDQLPAGGGGGASEPASLGGCASGADVLVHATDNEIAPIPMTAPKARHRLPRIATG